MAPLVESLGLKLAANLFTAAAQSAHIWTEAATVIGLLGLYDCLPVIRLPFEGVNSNLRPKAVLRKALCRKALAQRRNHPQALHRLQKQRLRLKQPSLAIDEFL